MKKIFAIMVVAMATMVCSTINAQEKKESPWVEVQVVDIPSGQTVYEGVTKSGNPKCWFEFGDITVSVSPSNAAKYKEGLVLVLVKWQHKENGKFKYTTRQKYGRVAKVTPDVDLNKIF
jgi:hypothetical protein